MFRKNHAFSTLEVLVTVFIFALVFGFSLLYTQLGHLRTDLQTQAAILESYLKEAQSNAASGKGGASFGVHLETSAFTLFTGTSYDVNDPSNFVVTLPGVIEIGAVALQGAGTELVFDPPLGTTEEYGTFELSSSRMDRILTFTITSLGQISYE